MITPEVISSIDNMFRGIRAGKEYKLIKANLDKSRTVEATYRYKSRELNKDIELTFSIPRFFLNYEDPIVDIGTLSDICRSLELNESYVIECLNISSEKIRVEFFNKFDYTSMKITIPRDNVII